MTAQQAKSTLAGIKVFLFNIEKKYPVYRRMFGESYVDGMAFINETLTEIIKTETKPIKR